MLLVRGFMTKLKSGGQWIPLSSLVRYMERGGERLRDINLG